MPFAGYKNFQDCVNKNQDKRDPEAYCATIQRQVEGDALLNHKTAIFNTIPFGEDLEPLREIQLLPVGEWKSPTHGDFKITESVIDDMIENFNADVRGKAELDINVSHRPQDGAAGWIKKLLKKADGLYAIVEWTSKGLDLLKGGVYKYISPEVDWLHVDSETGGEISNVLVGAGLTNRPFFKSLPSLTMSERCVIYFREMNLEDLLAKNPEELTDEEIAFLAEHADELSDEDKEKFADALEKEEEDEENDEGGEGNDEEDEDEEEEDDGEEEDEDKDEEDKEEFDEKDGYVRLKAEELKSLKSQAVKGEMAFQAFERRKVEDSVESMIFSEENYEKGKLLPKVRKKIVDFMLGLDKDQRKDFQEIITALPETTVEYFEEKGRTGENVKTLTAQDKVIKMASKLQKENKIDFSEALDLVQKEHPELVEAYQKALEAEI